MNKTPATLIGQNYYREKPTGVNVQLATYELRAANPYMSPLEVMSVITPLFGVPYKMIGLAMQTCNNMYLSAPEPTVKSGEIRQSTPLYTAGQYVIGQAPTKGVFTGVEGSC